MNQVIQVGEIEGSIHYYIEDYAYTYLKKQKEKEKIKYFLYGEKEEHNQQTKLYIYGISEKPKMEQTYFKEYYPLGFMKIKDGEKFWVSLKGQEEKISGFFVFYAPNQAMQEYLVDNHNDVKEEPVETRAKRSPAGEVLPVKEVAVPIRKIKSKKKKQEKGVLPFGMIAIAMFMIFLLSSANGQKKIEIFKQVIAETMSGVVMEKPEDIIIIEESIPKETEKAEGAAVVQEETSEMVEEETLSAEEVTAVKETVSEEVDKEEMQVDEILQDGALDNETLVLSEEIILDKNESAVQKEVSEGTESSEQSEIEKMAEESYEEYTVKKGDTLAAICRKKYGSLTNMDKICTLNNIENADHISPGQKLYLP